MQLSELSVTEAIEGLKGGHFSSVELVTACLGRAKELNPKFNALITLCEKEALLEAGKADTLIQKKFSGRDNLPLLGIPIVLKDLFSTAGIPTTAASKVLEDYIPVYDSTVVERLKKAGAIIIGKANLDAWGHGGSGENSDFGATRNPWDPALVPGGSSSGSAAAVSLGMGLAATATDTGGSIRLPASFCNLVGLKPTYGRVSRYGIIAMASSMDSIGHLTRKVADAALILQVTAGPDGKDSTMPMVAVDDYSKNLSQGVKGLKLGIPRQYLDEGVEREIKDQVMGAVSVFKKLGAQVREVSLPSTKYALAAYYIIQPSEVSSNLARYDGIRFGQGQSSFGDEAKRRIMLGTYTLSAGYQEAYYLKAQKVRTLIKNDFDRVFEEVDLLVSPVSPTMPWKLGEKVDDPLKMYLSDVLTVTANLAGIPALALPVGFSSSLPVGIQLLGPQFSEKLLFQAGTSYERETQYYKQQPNLKS